VLWTGEVEDLNAVVVGDPQGLPGPADAPATAIEAAVGCPAKNEARWASQVGAEHLMAVACV